MPQEFSRLTRLLTALAGFTVLAACGGGGGGGGGGPSNPPPGGGGGGTVTVSGKITFDRIPFSSSQGGGLNPSAPVESPAREVVVEAVTGTTVHAATTTDANGDYSFSVPASTSMLIRARARMQKTGAAPTWTFTVRDNTDSDAIYVLDGATFNSGTANVTRNLRAASGWGGSSYTGGRAAAPFAILDTVYRAKELIRSASPNAEFPELNLYWSDANRNVTRQDGSQVFCPDDGAIGTSFYFRDPSNTTTDDCDQPEPLPAGIYVLGSFEGGDTDEFDAHVIAHEFGHYFEDRFSRSDSLGGQHSTADRLDLRVAFGEGWGNAFGAMALNDPMYRDSSSGQDASGGFDEDFGFNLETGLGTGNILGWYSEGSVGKVIWDVFDTTSESGDGVTLGFTPIFNVMTDEQVDTPSLTSIFSFASALRDNNGSQSSEIEDLLQREAIGGDGEFGENETNGSGDPGFVDVYSPLVAPGMVNGLCSVNGTRDGNKLGNRRFVRLVMNSAGTAVIQAQGFPSGAGTAAAQDPDIFVHQRGAVRASGESNVAGSETVTVPLNAGTYVIEVYAFETINPDTSVPLVTTPRCMNLSVQVN